MVLLTCIVAWLLQRQIKNQLNFRVLGMHLGFMELDPFHCSCQWSTNELLAYHQLDVPCSSAINHLSCCTKVNWQLTFRSYIYRTTILMLEYSSYVCGGSCCVASWTSPNIKERSHTDHLSSGHSHLVAAHSNKGLWIYEHHVWIGRRGYS